MIHDDSGDCYLKQHTGESCVPNSCYMGGAQCVRWIHLKIAARAIELEAQVNESKPASGRVKLNDLKPGYYWFKLGSREECAESAYQEDSWRLGIWNGEDWHVPNQSIESLNHKLIQLIHPIPTPDGKMSDIDESEELELSMKENRPCRTNADWP